MSESLGTIRAGRGSSFSAPWSRGVGLSGGVERREDREEYRPSLVAASLAAAQAGSSGTMHARLTVSGIRRFRLMRKAPTMVAYVGEREV